MKKDELFDLLRKAGFVSEPQRAGFAPQWVRPNGTRVTYTLNQPEKVGTRCGCTGSLHCEVFRVVIYWDERPFDDQVLPSEFQEHYNLERLADRLRILPPL